MKFEDAIAERGLDGLAEDLLAFCEDAEGADALLGIKQCLHKIDAHARASEKVCANRQTPPLTRVVELVSSVQEIIFVHHPNGIWSARARVDGSRVGDVGDGATPELALTALIVELEAHARRLAGDT